MGNEDVAELLLLFAKGPVLSGPPTSVRNLKTSFRRAPLPRTTSVCKACPFLIVPLSAEDGGPGDLCAL